MTIAEKRPAHSYQAHIAAYGEEAKEAAAAKRWRPVATPCGVAAYGEEAKEAAAAKRWRPVATPCGVY